MALTDPKPMLEGVKVIDMSSVVFGPLTTQVLADLGAEVIKIETPTGDDFRRASKPAVSPKMSPEFMALNRNKKSVVLDLKDPDDALIMRNMLKTADIFIHNVRPKAIARLNLDYEAVKAFNSEILYIHCLGFGGGGPYSDLQAYDDVVQAASGVATLLPRVDGDPRPRFLPSLLADKAAGLHGVYATMAAMIHKLRTGQGQCVEVPLFETFCNFMLKEHLSGHAFEPKVGQVGYDRQIDPDRQPFPTKDGHIAIVPYRPEHWPIVFEAVGDPGFSLRPEFADPRNWTATVRIFYRRLAQLTPSKTSAEWEVALRAVNIPAQAVRNLDAVLDDPHLKAVGFFKKTEHPSEGTYNHLSEPSRFSAWEGPTYGPAPLLGQHTRDVKGAPAEPAVRLKAAKC